MKMPEITVELIIFSIFALGFLIQLFYYLVIFSRLAFYRKPKGEENCPPVSVIVCARNEDHNLAELLPLVLTQDYPAYEVVAVNDCSFDNTGDVLKELGLKYPHLKIVTIKEDEYYQHGKKFAVMV